MSQAVATRRTPVRNSNGHRAVVMPAKPRATKPAANAPRATHRFVVDDVSIGIPGWVVDHASFRRWFYLPEFPEEGRVSFLNGEVIFNLSRQQIYSHVRMKTIVSAVLSEI